MNFTDLLPFVFFSSNKRLTWISLIFCPMCVHRKRPQDDTAGPSKVKKNKAPKKKKTPKKKKNTSEKEAEKGCYCSSSKGCEKPDGPHL